MAVRRIVTNLSARDPAALADFDRTVLGLDRVMDHGWIVTLGGPATQAVQMSLASEGGSGTPVPALSIEVDDLDDCLSRARDLGAPIASGPADEPWGVRRFFVRDPAGHLVNILSHADPDR